MKSVYEDKDLVAVPRELLHDLRVLFSKIAHDPRYAGSILDAADALKAALRKPVLVTDRVENLEAALKTAHDVFAAEIEGLHKIILMNQPDYKRTIVASVDGL